MILVRILLAFMVVPLKLWVSLVSFSNSPPSTFRVAASLLMFWGSGVHCVWTDLEAFRVAVKLVSDVEDDDGWILDTRDLTGRQEHFLLLGDHERQKAIIHTVVAQKKGAGHVH